MRLSSHFYAIADPIGGHDPAELAKTLLEAGARILQLRMKQASAREFLSAARAIRSLCRKHDALFIVNDRPDVALLAGADGVHLGQNDLPLKMGRRLLGQGSVIGVSTASVEQARAAEEGGASYIGFGPMYPGGTKQIVKGQGIERLAEVRTAVKIPIVAIGGITEERVPEVLRAGADAAAIISDVVLAQDIGAKVRAIIRLAQPV
jgi:thiamine-phosphate diphosphorylase